MEELTLVNSPSTSRDYTACAMRNTKMKQEYHIKELQILKFVDKILRNEFLNP